MPVIDLPSRRHAPRGCRHRWLPGALFAASLCLVGASDARAHCDALDGPVVADARVALASRDVTAVLKWVTPEAEGEVRDAFRQALAVRSLGPEARSLADRSFFETLVRLHRQGEGAPFTGLKPAGQPRAPAVAAADQALEAGSVIGLASMLASELEAGLRARFERVVAARRSAAEGVARGREYVAAYTEFVHYAERLHGDAAGQASAASHEDPEARAHRP